MLPNYFTPFLVKQLNSLSMNVYLCNNICALLFLKIQIAMFILLHVHV